MVRIAKGSGGRTPRREDSTYCNVEHRFFGITACTVPWSKTSIYRSIDSKTFALAHPLRTPEPESASTRCEDGGG